MSEPSPRDKWAEWVLAGSHGDDAEQKRRWLEFLGPIRDRLLENAGIGPGKTLLDVGAGDGLIAFGAAPLVGESGRVLLCDVSQDLLDHSRATAGSWPNPNARTTWKAIGAAHAVELTERGGFVLHVDEHGVDRRPTEPAARPSVGRCRRRPISDRLQPSAGRGTRRAGTAFHQDPPPLSGRARRRDVRRAEGAPRPGGGTSPGCRPGTDGRFVCVQLSAGRREAVASELGDEAIHRCPARRGPATLPTARSPPLHGDRDARGRSPHRDRVAAPQPRPGCQRRSKPGRLSPVLSSGHRTAGGQDLAWSLPAENTSGSVVELLGDLVQVAAASHILGSRRQTISLHATIGDPGDLPIRTFVNGELRQDSSTADMVFGVAELVAYLSRYMTLVPGDVVLTGTPQGVIFGSASPWLTSGDAVTVEVGDLGACENRLV